MDDKLTNVSSKLQLASDRTFFASFSKVALHVESAASTRLIATVHLFPVGLMNRLLSCSWGHPVSRFETAGHVLMVSGWNKCEKRPLFPDSRRQHTCLSSAAGTNMKMTIPADREGASRQSAYTLPEVMMGI